MKSKFHNLKDRIYPVSCMPARRQVPALSLNRSLQDAVLQLFIDKKSQVSAQFSNHRRSRVFITCENTSRHKK